MKIVVQIPSVYDEYLSRKSFCTVSRFSILGFRVFPSLTLGGISKNCGHHESSLKNTRCKFLELAYEYLRCQEFCIRFLGRPISLDWNLPAPSLGKFRDRSYAPTAIASEHRFRSCTDQNELMGMVLI